MVLYNPPSPCPDEPYEPTETIFNCRMEKVQAKALELEVGESDLLICPFDKHIPLPKHHRQSPVVPLLHDCTRLKIQRERMLRQYVQADKHQNAGRNNVRFVIDVTPARNR